LGQFMGDGGSQLSHGSNACDMSQLSALAYDFGFRALPMPALSEQGANCTRLRKEHRQGNQNPLFVLFPGCRWPIADKAIGWNSAFVDAPPFQSAPINHRS